jgi:hypothetical protein
MLFWCPIAACRLSSNLHPGEPHTWSLPAEFRGSDGAGTFTELPVERRILFSTIHTAYDAHTIDRVYVRHPNKGPGSCIRFKSGRNKRLSMSLELTSLEAFTVALNTILYTHYES